jgi:hypothetical protein
MKRIVTRDHGGRATALCSKVTFCLMRHDTHCLCMHCVPRRHNFSYQGKRQQQHSRQRTAGHASPHSWHCCMPWPSHTLPPHTFLHHMPVLHSSHHRLSKLPLSSCSCCGCGSSQHLTRCSPHTMHPAPCSTAPRQGRGHRPHPQHCSRLQAGMRSRQQPRSSPCLPAGS